MASSLLVTSVMVSPTRIISLALTVTLVASAGQAQSPQLSPPPPRPGVFTPDQLDQLLAPIALHPDPLVGQILMAATYPLEVVQATRWLQDPNHAALTGSALVAALDLRPWDPSVKALVSFPEILRMMDGALEWTEAVGDAFLSDQVVVMDAIQRLRLRAQSAGTLVTTPQQMVLTQDQAIGIIPADPQVVYVPMYDPAAVYGTWVYVPSPYFGYRVVAPVGVVGGLSFGVGIVVVPYFWGWHHWDWHHHRLHVDHDRFAHISGHRPPPGRLATRPGPPSRGPLSRSGNARALRGSPSRRRAWLRNGLPGGHSPQERHRTAARCRSFRKPRLTPREPRSRRRRQCPRGATDHSSDSAAADPDDTPRDSCRGGSAPPARPCLRILRAGRRRSHADRAGPVEPPVHRPLGAAGSSQTAIKRDALRRRPLREPQVRGQPTSPVRVTRR